MIFMIRNRKVITTFKPLSKAKRKKVLNLNNKLETMSNLFEDNEIRSIWDSEKEDYYFSVVDVISALTDSNNPRNYWNMLKKRMTEEEQSELSTKCVQLKMKSKKDGKSYSTDTLDTKGILRLIESVPSPKAEPFKLWLASLGSEKSSEYKAYKGIRKESLRDNMTDIEVALTNIGEIAARDIATSEHLQGLSENMNVAKRGGKVANDARLSYEKETKKSAISKDNALNYQYVDDQPKIESTINE